MKLTIKEKIELIEIIIKNDPENPILKTAKDKLKISLSEDFED